MAQPDSQETPPPPISMAYAGRKGLESVEYRTKWQAPLSCLQTSGVVFSSLGRTQTN